MEFLWLKALHILPLPIYTRAFVSALMVSICQFVVSLLLAHWFFNAALLLTTVQICMAEFYCASQAAFNLPDQYRYGYIRFLFRIVAYPLRRTTIRGGYFALLPIPAVGPAFLDPFSRCDWLQVCGQRFNQLDECTQPQPSVRGT